MKRAWIYLLLLALLCTGAAPARADDDPSSTIKPATLNAIVKSVNKWFDQVKDESAKVLKGEPVYPAKIMFAVYSSDSDTAPLLSIDPAFRENYSLDLAEGWLAAGMKEAETLVIIHKDSKLVGYYATIPAMQVKTQVTVIDLVSKARYATFTAVTSDPPSNSRYGTTGTYQPQKAMEQIAAQLKKLKPAGDKAKYQKAEKLFEKGKYYSASEAFKSSLYKDWRDQVKKCVQKFPKTGEIYHNSKVKGSASRITVQAEASSSGAGLIACIYKGDTAASYLFINGTGTASAKLPAGTYSIRIGQGSTWYGTKEFFGKEGQYEVIHPNNGNAEKISLSSGDHYTLYVSVAEVDPNATGVDSQSESWENFVK